MTSYSEQRSDQAAIQEFNSMKGGTVGASVAQLISIRKFSRYTFSSLTIDSARLVFCDCIEIHVLDRLSAQI